MELTEKTLRKFFLEAFEQTVMPRLDSIDRELFELKGEMKEVKGNIKKINQRLTDLEKKLLDLEEKIFPKFAELKEQFAIVIKELDFMKKSGGNKEVLKKIKWMEKFIAQKSREVLQFKVKLEKFESDLRQLKQAQKRKTVK